MDKEKYVTDIIVGNKKTNFEKLIENDKEKIIDVLASECCIDTNKYKIETNRPLPCEKCIFNYDSCVSQTKEWLESEVEK